MTETTVRTNWQAEAASVLTEKFLRPGFTYNPSMVSPSTWPETQKQALPGTLTQLLTENQSILLNGRADDLAPITVGDMLRNLMSENLERTLTWNTEKRESIGRWLLSQLPLVRTFADPGTYPDALSANAVLSARMLGFIRDWADSTPPAEIPATVDEAMRRLSDLGYWPTDALGTTEGAKDFLGAVLRYMRRRSESDRPWQVGDFARVVVENAENSGAHIGWYVQLDSEHHGTRSRQQPGDTSPTFFYHRVQRDGSPYEGHGTNFYIPTSALVAWSPEPGEAAVVWQVGMLAEVTEDHPFSAWCVRGDLVRLAERRLGRQDYWYVQQVNAAGQVVERPEHHYVPTSALRPYTPPRIEGVSEYDALVEAVRADYRLLAQSLSQEAQERSWCSEYESVMRRISDRLQVPGLLPGVENFRQRLEQETFEVEVSVDLTLTINGVEFTGSGYTLDVNVRGWNEEDARDHLDFDAVRDAVYEDLPGCVDGDFTIDDWHTT